MACGDDAFNSQRADGVRCDGTVAEADHEHVLPCRDEAAQRAAQRLHGAGKRGGLPAAQRVKLQRDVDALRLLQLVRRGLREDADSMDLYAAAGARVRCDAGKPARMAVFLLPKVICLHGQIGADAHVDPPLFAFCG